MKKEINRREFLQFTVAGSTLYFGGSGILAFGANQKASKLISPGCRRSKVKVARVYMADPKGPWNLWPKPNLNLKEEIRFYESEFAKLKDELYDVDFVVDELVTSVEQVSRLQARLKNIDGILAIQLGMGILPILNEILRLGQPTMVFAVPYSGHGWSSFGQLQKQQIGAKMECMLTSDYKQLAVAIRPFRAIHHLKEARILNLTTGSFAEYADDVKNKFGTEIKRIELKRVLDACDAVDDSHAQVEAERWIK